MQSTDDGGKAPIQDCTGGGELEATSAPSRHKGRVAR